MHLIIDSDPIVYRAGFAAQRTEYHIVYNDKEVDCLGEAHFSPKEGATAGAQMKAWLADNADTIEVIDKQAVVIPEPESHALETVRTQLRSIEKECRQHYGIDNFSEISVILSGPGNYREKLATVFPYKGNRDSEHKPHWYQSIRNYLAGEWGARVVHGREADDECSIIARTYVQASDDRTAYVVATIDKDLDQIPGNHYNYQKQVFYEQSVSDSERFFYQQALTGDPTDGIPGCYRIGNERGSKFIAEQFPVSADVPGLRKLWGAIVAQYAKSQQIPGCPYVGRDAAAVALETARLVKLQEYPGQLWTPPGQPDDLLEEFKDDE